MKKNKLGYYFIQEFLKNYLSILFAFGLIIWITQAVRLLDLIGEEGNSIKTYFLYILSIMPKYFSKISLIIFFISLVVTISKFEDHNELRALWFSGLEKKKFINYLIRSSIILIVILVIVRCFIIPYFSNYSRHLLLNSSVGDIGPLLKQNNFNNPLKKITIYVGKKNQINELEDIILFEDSADIKKTIIAEDVLEKVLDYLPLMDKNGISYKPLFKIGDHKELLAFFKQTQGNSNYPLIWLEMPFAENHINRKRVKLNNLNFILAVETNTQMLYNERLKSTFLILNDLLDNHFVLLIIYQVII